MTALFTPMTIDQLREQRRERLLEAFPGEDTGPRRGELVPYISPSQIKTALRCLNQYRLRYVLGLKSRPNSAMLWGTADHAAVEWAMRDKIVTHADKKPAEVAEMFATALDEQVERDGGAAEVEWKEGEDHASVKDAGAKLVTVYAKEALPKMQPSAVEEKFLLDTPDLPIPVKGYVDLIADVPTWLGEREEKIVDRKTAGRKAFPVESRIQARVYQLARPLPFEFHLSLKTKTPGIVAFDPSYYVDLEPAHITVKRIQRAVMLIASCYDTYGPDEEWPEPGGFSDICGYCGFKDDGSCGWWA